MVNNRRNFFKSLYQKTDTQPLTKLQQDDPLFKKYSKKVGGRVTNSQSLARKKPITTGLAEFTGTFTAAEANHLLRRTQYGITPIELSTALGKTMSQAVDDLFNFNFEVSVPSVGPVNNYQNTSANPQVIDPTGIQLGDVWTKKVFTANGSSNNDISINRRNSLRYWRWGVYFNEGNTIREKLTDFWAHFIPIDFTDASSGVGTNSPIFCYDYYQILRNNCKGNYRTIIEQISKSNAMLGYLSGQSSTKTIPNENFARELFELFTIGKDDIQENNNYTEDDIKAASKIFSGWRMNSPYSATHPVPVTFNDNFHNQDAKVFSEKFGNVTIANQLGPAGANEFGLFFNMLFVKQAVKISEYIMERLYRFFVYYEIDAFTKTNVIVPLAAQFRDDNWEILPVLKKLLKSEHFYDVINLGVMIKSPFDFIIGTMRCFQINTTKPNGNATDQYSIYRYFNGIGQGMEQASGEFPTVSGHKAYYQKPTFYQNWINSTNVQKRESFINTFLNGVTRENLKMQLDLVAYVKLFPLATQQYPDTLIDAVIKNLLPKDIDATFKNDVLKKAGLLNNQTSDYYWTDAWNAHLGAPTDAAKLKIVTDRLKAMFTTMLKLAEYQLM